LSDHRTPDPHHTLQIDTRIGPLHLHADVAFSASWTVIFGPSGSGKSSLLRALCGLIPCRAFVGHSLTDSASPAVDLTKTPTHRRNLAYAPQGAILFPHLTVRQNIAFSANTPHVDDAIELFALGKLADRLPRDLSGGERQRVSLARAFAVPDPRLALLDEPFTGIDRTLRDQLLPQIQHSLASRDIPCISVTHDIEEPLLLNAEVIRLEAGQVTAQGPAHQILADERIRALQTLTATRS
jgi:molybdate transport system ATP-binding protein